MLPISYFLKVLLINLINILLLGHYWITIDPYTYKFSVMKLNYGGLDKAHKYVQIWLEFLDTLMILVTWIYPVSFNLAHKWEGIAWHQKSIQKMILEIENQQFQQACQQWSNIH